MIYLTENTRLPGIFVHTCCGPCLASVFDDLIETTDDITIYYYNPNIHPFLEFNKRLKTLNKFVNGSSARVLAGSYHLSEYFKAIENHYQSPERCRFCYRFRLENACRKARRLNYNHFTTTIFSSPYQEHGLALEESLEITEKYELNLVYYDTRENYFDGINKIREMGLYYQWYCGCVFSEYRRVLEKEKKIRAKSAKE